MGRKHKTTLYGQSMSNVYELVHSQANEQFRSMLTTTKKTGESEYSKMTLNDLMLHYQSNLYRLSQHVPQALNSNGSNPEIDAAENELLQLGTEIQNRFTEYKKKHNEYEGDDYRKYEYMSHVISVYNAAQESLDAYKDVDQYDPTIDANNQKIAADDYIAARNDLMDKAIDFDLFRKDLNYDASFLSNATETLVNDRDLTAEVAMDVGAHMFLNDIEVAVKQENEDISQLTESYNEGKTKIENDRLDAVNDVNTKFDTAKGQIVDQTSAELGRLQDEERQISAEIGDHDIDVIDTNYREAALSFNAIDIDKVSYDVRGGGQPLSKQGAYNSWIDSIDFSNDDAIKQRMDILDASSKKLAEKYDLVTDTLSKEEIDYKALKEELANEEAILANPGKDPQYKKFEENLKISADGIKELDTLMDDIRSKGVDKIASERLAKYGLSNITKEVVTEAIGSKEDIDAFNKIATKRTRGIFSSTMGDNLSKGIKDLNQVFNVDYDKLEQAAAEYARQHEGKSPLNITKELKDSLPDAKKSLDELKGFGGKLKTAKEAANINKVFNNANRLKIFADSIPDDAPKILQDAKKSVNGALKSFEDLQNSPDAYISLITLAGVAETYGTNKEMTDSVLNNLNDIAKQKKQEYSELESQTTLKFKKDQQAKVDGLKSEVEQFDKDLEFLKTEKAQDELDIKYIETSKKLLETKTAKAQYNDKRVDLSDRRQKNLDAQKKLEKDYRIKLENLESMRKDALNDTNGIFDKQGSELDNAYKKEVGEHTNRIASMTKFKDKLNALVDCSKETIQAAREFNNKTTTLKNKMASHKALIQNNRNKMINGLSQTEKATYEKMKSSKRFLFGNSDLFEDMMKAMKDYVDANEAGPNVKNSVQQSERAAKARIKIGAYINERDTAKGKLKTTPTGQLRLDCAKQFLKLLDQKESQLNMYNNELDKISTKAGVAKEVSIKYNIEKQAVQNRQVQLDAKVEIAPRSEIKMLTGMGKIRAYFEGSKEMVSAKNEYLGKAYEFGIKRLMKRDMNGFTKGVAAAFVAEYLKDKKLDSSMNKSLDKIVDLFSKTDSVKNFATQIATGEIKTDDMKATLNNHEMAKQAADEMNEMSKQKQGPQTEAAML